jgi:hydantoinase/carbamoylase family amidase
MGYPFSDLRISEERFRADFEALAKIGATPDGGVHRPTFSAAHLQAREWLRHRIEQAGLDAQVDGAGNHTARLQCGPPGAKVLLLGSHLDSVPNGGRFDGPLGVLCALEVIQTIREAGASLPFDLEVVDFTDEEGTFGSFWGSRAFTGKLPAEEVENPYAGPEELERGLQRADLNKAGFLAAKRSLDEIAGYLEVHIEQGPRLDRSGIDIGVVTDIVGIRRYYLTLAGVANHAGTTPMRDRRDAAQGASAFALAVRETVMREFGDCVANVGRMDFEPGAFNVVPAAVRVWLELRSVDASQALRLERSLFEQAREQAERFGLGLHIEQLEAVPPEPMSANVQQNIRESAELLGLTHVSLPSGAGHDAQSFADLCPTGMIFVPSVDGYSHTPQEFTEWQDCVNGANVLLHTVLKMAGAE